MRFGDLTYEEIRERAGQGWLTVVPTGCTEQMGPHLPVDFDTWQAEHYCLAASERAASDFGVQSLVLPVMPFGPTPEHRNFSSGYIDIPKDLHESLVFAVLKSLAEQGFKKIIVWRGCGGHDLREAVKRFNRQYRRKAKAYLPGHPFHDIWCRRGNPDNPGGHADAFATSISLYLRPETVRTEKIFNPHSKEVDWADPNLDFSRYSETGVIGDPTEASVELGKKLWEAIIEEMALVFKSIAEGKEGNRLTSQDRLHFLRRES
jgi:creatinine amidohydrolase